MNADDEVIRLRALLAEARRLLDRYHVRWFVDEAAKWQLSGGRTLPDHHYYLHDRTTLDRIDAAIGRSADA